MTQPTREQILAVARDVLRDLGLVAGEPPAREAGGPPAGAPSPRDAAGPAARDAGPARPAGGRALIGEAEVRAAKARGERVLALPPGALLTPLARDVAHDLGLELREASSPVAARPDAAPDGGPAPQDGGRIALGADHGGFALKGRLLEHLRARGLPCDDLGTFSKDACDYPDLAAKVARAVALGDAAWGVLVDGAGIGSCMAANKVPGVLAATCHDERAARNAREHNGSNVLCLGTGSLDEAAAVRVLDAWLATPFAGGRHGRRVDKIRALERGFVRA